MRAAAWVVVGALTACAGEPPAEDSDGGAGPDDALAVDGGGCAAPRAAPPWLDAYLTTTIARLAGAADLAPGVRLSDRATATRRAAVRDFLVAELAAMGRTATVDDYGTGANVELELPATTATAGGLIVVGAHLDSVSGSPGADDNATGTAAVLALARILGDVACRDRPVRLVWFDQEEVGLIGSTYLAIALQNAGTPVTAVHTLDMFGWDGDGDRTLEVERPTPALLAAYQAAAADVGVTVRETDSGSTDHVAFRDRGFAAVGLSEEFVGGDATPHYHQPTDTAATVVIPQVALGVRLVARVVARQAGAP